MLNFLNDFRPGPETVPPGDYAMWSPSPDEPLFAPSETRRNLGRVYQCVEGIETFALASLLRGLQLVGQDVGRVALPDDLASFPVLGPDGQVLAVSVSSEKGIRFHFHQSASGAYRNRVLTGFVAYLEALRRAVALSGVSLDEPRESSPAEWWVQMEKVVCHMEETGEPVQAVGKVLIG